MSTLSDIHEHEMKVKLDDNSRIHLVWLQDGSLAVQMFKPGHLKDGHGFVLTASGIVAGEELNAFINARTKSCEHGFFTREK